MLVKSRHSLALIILLLLGLFFAPKQTSAAFIKDSLNPSEQVGYQDSTDMRQNDVFVNNNTNNLEALQSTKAGSSYSIYQLVSIDKGRSWNLTKSVISKSSNLFAPRALHLTNKIELYLTEEIPNNFKITRMDCDSQFNCNLGSYETVLTSTNNTWDAKGVTSAFPIVVDSLTNIFYTGYNGSSWALGLAIFENGTWTKCPNPILYNYGDGTFVRKVNGLYELFYHNPFGGNIYKRTSPDPISCNMQWSDPEIVLSAGEPYDNQHMIAPSVVDFDGRTYLFYTGRGNNTWTLNVATDPPIPSITPTGPPSPSPSLTPSQTPTPTPSPTPTPTPNPAETTQVVLIPGMFSSWNEEGLLHNQQTPPDQWILNPIITEYQGIIKTLENIGFVQGQTLFTFAYDWRKPIRDGALTLKNFINTNLDPQKKHAIVGHSLGGLVGRAYMQDTNPPNTILTTVGSPHKGIATVYPALAAGDVQTPDMPTWLGQKLLLQIAKKFAPLTPDNLLLQTQLPVLYDLLPTTPYLFNNANPITPQSMQLKNTTLPILDQTLQNYLAVIRTTLGTSIGTLASYQTRPRTLLEQYLNYYIDGAVGASQVGDGDGLVLGSSAQLPSISLSLPQRDHRELIYTKEAISSILNTLDIPFTNDMLEPGVRTALRPALIGVILSPAELSIVHDGTTYPAHDGLVFIPNPTSDTYTVLAKGKAKGDYTIILGATGPDNDTWKTITGSITSSNPTSETDSYQIILDSSTPMISLPTEATVLSLKEHILATKNTQTQALVTSALLLLEKAQQNISQNKTKVAYQYMLNLHHVLFIIRDLTKDQQQAHAKEAIKLLHDYAGKILTSQSTKKQLVSRSNQLQTTLEKLIKSGLSLAKFNPPSLLKKDNATWATNLLLDAKTLVNGSASDLSLLEWKLHGVQELEYRLP